MVGVLALFPVASSTGRESSEETQAAIIAQTILGELRTSAELRGRTNAWFVRGQDPADLSQLQTVNLNQAATFVVAFDVALRNKANSGSGSAMIGPPIALKAYYNRVITGHKYANALTTVAGVTYLGRVAISPVTRPITNGASLITVDISTPANTALTNRRSFSFSSLVYGP
jgi:hypothetical protein